MSPIRWAACLGRLLIVAARAALLLMIAIFGGLPILACLALLVAPLLLDGAPPPTPPPSARFDAEHRVTFPSLAPPLERFEGMGDEAEGYLFRPAGAGPFPAVVMLHGCSGFFGLQGYRRWVDRLVGWGYVVLAVDGLSWRGASFCFQVDRITPPEYAGDAYGGLRYLAALPLVDARRIAALGHSYGAGTLLAAVANRGGPGEDAALAAGLPALGSLRFRAGVGFYPALFPGAQRFSVPLLLLVGERDGLGNAVRVRALGEAAQRRGDPVAFHIYPGAGHGFDAETPLEMGLIPFTYDAAATADAAVRVKRFLEENLRGR